MRGMMWLMALGGGILLSSSGCCGFLGRGCCGGGCDCESCGRCQADCGPTCGQVRHPCENKFTPTTAKDAVTAGHARVVWGVVSATRMRHGCCQRNFCFHPLRWIGRLFYCGTWCGPSCGETYWGEAYQRSACLSRALRRRWPLDRPQRVCHLQSWRRDRWRRGTAGSARRAHPERFPTGTHAGRANAAEGDGTSPDGRLPALTGIIQVGG